MTNLSRSPERCKRKKPFSLLMPDELRTFLEERAREGNRPLTREIVMRLQMTRESRPEGRSSEQK